MEPWSQLKVFPVAAATACHRSSPSNTAPYRWRNMSEVSEDRMASVTSSGDGQRSDSRTGLPSASVPNGSVVRSMSMVPPSA